MKKVISTALILCICSQVSAQSNCATVSTLFDGPESERVYPARISTINGNNVVLDKKEHTLPAGRHTLLIMHTDQSLLQHAQSKDFHFSQEMTLDVVPGKVYRVGAKFNSTKRFKPNEKWTAIVWEISDKECLD